MKGHMDTNARPINMLCMIRSLDFILLILSINLYYTYSKAENQDKRISVASIFSFIILISWPILNNILSFRVIAVKSIENTIKNNREAIILMVFVISIFAYLFSIEKLKRKLME